MKVFLSLLSAASLCGAALVAQQVADIVIYNDSGPNAGAWDPSINGIKAVANRYGYTYDEVTPEQLNDGLDLSQYYRIFYMPGGWAGYYNRELNSTGDQAIRDFVTNGGGYMGMCAGAFYASDEVQWKPTESTPLETYNYPSNMFLGTSRGVVLALAPWELDNNGDFPVLPDGGIMTTITINQDIVPLSADTVTALYYGGPYFIAPPGGWGDIEILAQYDLPGDIDDDKPAIIIVPYGQGELFLSALHPEVSYNFDTNTFFFDEANQLFLRGAIARLLGEESLVDFANAPMDTAIGKRVEVPTIPGYAYQLQISANSGVTWEDIGDPFLANAYTTARFIEGDVPEECIVRAISQ
ncbi:MAG: BPL-N domain-containing protein [Verrucomicrobiota bacterium]